MGRAGAGGRGIDLLEDDSEELCWFRGARLRNGGQRVMRAIFFLVGHGADCFERYPRGVLVLFKRSI